MQRRLVLKSIALVGLPMAFGWSAALGQPAGRAKSGGATIDAKDFLKFGAQPEDEAFAALVAQLKSVAGPKVVRFPDGQPKLVLSGAKSFDLPDEVRWDFGKAVVRLQGSVGGNAVLLRFGQRSEVLGLGVEIGRGSSCDRLVVFRDDTLVDRLQVSSEAQLANGGDDSGDGLIQIRGSRVKMVASTLSGVDRPLVVIGSGAKQGESAALVGVQLNDLRVRDFVCGMFIRNAKDCRIEGLVAAGKSANAKTDPGHNAVLAARVENFVLTRFKIDDAGEHAIRIGGSTNPHEAPNKNIQISDGAIRRPGKCGVKFWSAGKSEDVADAAVEGAQVRQLSIFDCGFGGKISVNEDAVRLEVVNDFVVEGITAAAEKSAASCHDVVYLAACGNGRVNNINASRAVRSAVFITEQLGAGRRAPVGKIDGSDIRSSDHRGDFIHVDAPSQNAGPFVFTGLAARGGVNFVGGQAPKLSGDSRFDGTVQGNSGAKNALGNSRRASVNVRG